MITLILFLTGAAVVVLAFILRLRRPLRSHNLHGPPSYPLIGNLLDMPHKNVAQWLAGLRSVSNLPIKLHTALMTRTLEIRSAIQSVGKRYMLNN